MRAPDATRCHPDSDQNSGLPAKCQKATNRIAAIDGLFDHLISGDHFARRCGRGDRIAAVFAALHMSAIGTKRTFRDCVPMSAFGGKADIAQTGLNVCF
jgi:hypothetical protein